jgi:hypothetical protein
MKSGDVIQLLAIIFTVISLVGRPQMFYAVAICRQIRMNKQERLQHTQ